MLVLTKHALTFASLCMMVLPKLLFVGALKDLGNQETCRKNVSVQMENL